MTPSLLTYREAAEQLGGISEKTVKRLVSSGKIRAYRIAPRCHRVDGASLEAYVKQSRILPVITECLSGRTTAPTVGAYNGTAESLLETVERLKKQRLVRPARG